MDDQKILKIYYLDKIKNVLVPILELTLFGDLLDK